MPQKPSSPAKQPSLAAQLSQPADQPFTELSRALLRVNFLFVNHPERAYHAYDLTLAQVDVLFALAHAESGTLTCSEIAEKTLITKGGITGIVDRLEARGLVKRIPSSDDRRSVLVRLSAKGIELFRKLYPELVRGNRTLFERAFRPEQLKEFSRLLGQLISVLEMQ
ncbi:MAG TPA: MarR family transcriptional regulator [Candidatus Binataceae bacterium]|nr:MarR family transcriptional regulator [Candidatus Binataceae bacterium]